MNAVNGADNPMYVCMYESMYVCMHACMYGMYVCVGMYVRSQNKACMYFTEQSNAK